MTPDWNHNLGKAQSLSDLAGKQFQSPVPGGKNYRDFNLPDADKTPSSLLPPAPPHLPHGKERTRNCKSSKPPLTCPTMASA